MPAGYSGKPLIDKLGLKPGMRACAIGAPDNYVAMLGVGEADIVFEAQPASGVVFLHLFASRRGDLEERLPELMRLMDRDGMIWVSWPKKSSGVETDIREDAIREVALPLGLVDVKVCAVDEIWSGLKLVIRKELR